MILLIEYHYSYHLQNYYCFWQNPTIILKEKEGSETPLFSFSEQFDSIYSCNVFTCLMAERGDFSRFDAAFDMNLRFYINLFLALVARVYSVAGGLGYWKYAGCATVDE